MRGRLLIAAALLVACASTAAAPSAGAPASASTAAPAAERALVAAAAPAESGGGFAPAGEGAKRYAPTLASDGRRPPPPDPVRRSLLAEVRAAAGKLRVPVPGEDARLDWAMTDLARHIHDNQLPALDVLEFLLGHYGLIDPSPHILMAAAPLRGNVEISARARGELTEMLRAAGSGRLGIGIDRSADTIYIVVGLQESRVTLLKPVPRRLPPGGRAELAARIAPGYTKPEVAITAPGGGVREQTPAVRDGVVHGELRCAGDGRYQVEIVATGPTGSAVLANFPVYCGVAPATATPRGAGVRAVAMSADEAEAQILALINRDRQLAGVAPVVADGRLTAIARAHTHDMVDHDFVGHVSPRSGNTVERVHHAGLTPGFISENVGRGYTADEAEQGFMASPGHRANIVDPRPRRVGVGVVFGAAVSGTRPLFVTQLFTD